MEFYLDAMIAAAQHLFTLGPMMGILVVLPISLVSGLLPGGGLPVAVVILGFATYLDPWIAMTAVVFAMAISDASEPVPCILLGVPGTRSSQATVLDGYPMAQKGLAGVALGASYTSNFIGGLIGAMALLLSLPIARQIVLMLSSAEFFLLSLLGVFAVAVVSAGAFVKGMLTGVLGLAIAMIGFCPISGDIRATFGSEYLWDGFSFAPIVVGLFAIPEAIGLVMSGTPIARERMTEMLKDGRTDVYKGMREAFKHFWLMVYSSLIGVFVGMIPGAGGSAAHWLAYMVARQTEKGGRQTFGTGDVRGVIAPEAANNSVDGGVLIPTVAFGIPGSSGMALVLAILVLGGITPGPKMLTEHLDMTISLVYTIVLANVIGVPIMLMFAPVITRVAAILPDVLGPIVIGIVTLTAYMATQSLMDLVVVLGFAVLGIFMKASGWPRPPILIALVLAQTLEKYLWISINAFGWGMLLRPQFLIIIVILFAIMAIGMHTQRTSDRGMRQATGS